MLALSIFTFPTSRTARPAKRVAVERELAGLRLRKAKLVPHVDHEHDLLAIVGEALEQLHAVCNPERGMEAFADFPQTLREIQIDSLS